MSELVEIVARGLHARSFAILGPMCDEWEEFKDEALAALRAIEGAGKKVEQGWQPIETAPRDGTQVDLWTVAPRQVWIATDRDPRVPNAWFSEGKWWVYDEHGDDMCRSEIRNATHWRPKPTPPAFDAADTFGGGE